MLNTNEVVLTEFVPLTVTSQHLHGGMGSHCGSADFLGHLFCTVRADFIEIVFGSMNKLRNLETKMKTEEQETCAWGSVDGRLRPGSKVNEFVVTADVSCSAPLSDMSSDNLSSDLAITRGSLPSGLIGSDLPVRRFIRVYFRVP